MSKFLHIITSHYRLIIFILMWILLTLLWFIVPKSNPEPSYFVLLLFCSVVLGLFFVFIEILKEIPKIIGRIKERFGKKSGDKRGFFEKLWEVISYSPASIFLFICFIVAIMFGIAACLEPYIFTGESTLSYAARLFGLVIVVFGVLPACLIAFLGLFAWLL